MAELLGHGNHLVVTGSTKPEDMAKGMGLMLLALGELLEPGRQKSAFGTQKFASSGTPRTAAFSKTAPHLSKVSTRF
ncbi:MAG TPA: hypothetical protein VHU18_13175 [Rhizomicrobium sp.]|nr:hypothetical protein [Rhizomicrobium sp.]